MSSLPSSALRSSCSRKRGLPAARSMHANARRWLVSMNPPARTSASDICRGPRSIVSIGTAQAARQVASIGSPSTREVITRRPEPSTVANR